LFKAYTQDSKVRADAAQAHYRSRARRSGARFSSPGADPPPRMPDLIQQRPLRFFAERLRR